VPKLFKHYAKDDVLGRGYIGTHFSISACSWGVSGQQGPLTEFYANGTHWKGSCVDPTAVLHDMEKYKILDLRYSKLLIVQPIKCRYTDWAIAAPPFYRVE
jgi:hypothetical protein